MRTGPSENEHFCVLVIGDPGELGNLSMQSILQSSPRRVCALVDNLGSEWVDRIEIGSTKLICKHLIKEKHSWVLADLASDVKFENFGSAKFFRLMFLKWVVLQECMQENLHGSHLIFSDLDVLWCRNFEDQLHEFSDSPAQFALQNDSTRSREYFCPGIMIWKKSTSAQKILDDIREYHLDALTFDPYLPDDKAMNRWLLDGENMKNLYVLSSHQFVIGHRIYKLLLGISGYRLSSVVAFHANYSIGSIEKMRKLEAVSKSLNSYHYRYFYLIKLVLRRILQ
jgi:hypothetical protein